MDKLYGESAYASCQLHREQCPDPYCGRNELVGEQAAGARLQSERFVGALFQPAGGSLWAARVVFALLEEAIEAGVTLRTQTRVLAVEPAAAGGEEGGGYTVRTEGGAVVRARHVVYATNAYTASLLPEFEGKINPYRNQVVVTEPAPPLWDAMVWDSSPPAGSRYAYIIQRADGRIVIGANAGGPGDHLDDSVESISAAATERILAELRQTYLALAAMNSGEGIQAEQAHVGVTQWTADGFPWVGPLGELQPGNYIAAGFTEGMVQCFSAGHAVAQMLAGNPNPTPFNPRYLPSARDGSF
eukprot:SAG22_NODE_489_length_9845_cov_5.954550_5_plen_301_part_00